MKRYVISLDRTPQRMTEFSQLNKEFAVTKFPAVDGAATAKDQLAEKGWIAPDLTYSPGALGCAASHIEIWKEAVTSQTPVLVLEDDAVLHRDAERMLGDLMKQLPADWDYFVLGFNMDCPVLFDLLPGVTPTQCVFSPAALGANLGTFKTLDMRPQLYRLWVCFGTPGYIVSPAGAEKLLSKLLPLHNSILTCSAGKFQNTGIDIALNSAYGAISAHVSFPPLLITPNDKAKSTVQAA